MKSKKTGSKSGKDRQDVETVKGPTGTAVSQGHGPGKPREGPRSREDAGRFSVISDRGAALGFSQGKSRLVSARVNPELLRLAKEHTGAPVDSALIELALTNLVLEEGFSEALARLRGSVDDDIDLGI